MLKELVGEGLDFYSWPQQWCFSFEPNHFLLSSQDNCQDFLSFSSSFSFTLISLCRLSLVFGYFLDLPLISPLLFIFYFQEQCLASAVLQADTQTALLATDVWCFTARWEWTHTYHWGPTCFYTVLFDFTDSTAFCATDMGQQIFVFSMPLSLLNWWV